MWTLADYVYNSYVDAGCLCLQQLCKQLADYVYNSYVNSSLIMSTTAM